MHTSGENIIREHDLSRSLILSIQRRCPRNEQKYALPASLDVYLLAVVGHANIQSFTGKPSKRVFKTQITIYMHMDRE